MCIIGIQQNTLRLNKHVPSLTSYSFNKHGLILIFFGKQHQHTFKNDVHIVYKALELKKLWKILTLRLIITSIKEVTFSSAFVCLLARLFKNYSTNFHKFSGKVARGPQKKPLDFGGNLDRVTLGSGLGELWLRLCAAK